MVTRHVAGRHSLRRRAAGSEIRLARTARAPLILALVMAASASACRDATARRNADAAANARPSPPASPSEVTSAAGAPSAPSLAELGHAWVETLPLANGNLAYVMPPLAAREPRPLIVGVHGAGDRADWACGGWRLAASEYAFVVCPQGLKMDALRFAWDSPRTVVSRVQSALEAARARFGPHIAEGPTLYVGFSQGATLAGPVLLAERDRFPVVALAEGGYGLLRDALFLQRLHDNGTSRLMVVCGSAACFQTAKRVVSSLHHAGIEPLISGDARAGHNLNREMQLALHQAWPGFVSGLPNWHGFPEYLATRDKR